MDERIKLAENYQGDGEVLEAVRNANERWGQQYGDSDKIISYNVGLDEMYAYLSTKHPQDIFKELSKQREKLKEALGNGDLEYLTKNLGESSNMTPERIKESAEYKLEDMEDDLDRILHSPDYIHDPLKFKFTQVKGIDADCKNVRFYFGSHGCKGEPIPTISHLSGLDDILGYIAQNQKQVTISQIGGGYVAITYGFLAPPKQSRQILLFGGSKKFITFDRDLAKSDLIPYFNERLPGFILSVK